MIAFKKLEQNGEIFFPITSQEAVLVKNGDSVITLDKALNMKVDGVETLPLSGLSASRSGNTVYIGHTNNISPQTENKNVKIAFDNNGHITSVEDVNRLNINLKDSQFEYDGNEEVNVQMSDDFVIRNGEISLNWEENGNT